MEEMVKRNGAERASRKFEFDRRKKEKRGGIREGKDQVEKGWTGIVSTADEVFPVFVMCLKKYRFIMNDPNLVFPLPFVSFVNIIGIRFAIYKEITFSLLIQIEMYYTL